MVGGRSSKAHPERAEGQPPTQVPQQFCPSLRVLTSEHHCPPAFGEGVLSEHAWAVNVARATRLILRSDIYLGEHTRTDESSSVKTTAFRVLRGGGRAAGVRRGTAREVGASSDP